VCDYAAAVIFKQASDTVRLLARELSLSPLGREQLTARSGPPAPRLDPARLLTPGG
jgi:hypothetical protein